MMRVLLVLAGAATVMVLSSGSPAPPPPVAPPQADARGFTTEHWPPSPAAARGRVVYEQFCIGCHGDQGLGDGDSARWLNPLPRNFQAGNFKFRSTPSGELPTLEDVMHVVTCGLEGSAMRSFPLLAEVQRRDVSEYVLYLATFGQMKAEVEYVMDDEELTLEQVLADELDWIEEEVLEGATEGVYAMGIEQSPEVDEDLLARGEELYQSGCVACHGASGKGDGPSSFSLRDWKDDRIVPRDFTTGVFRAGSSPRDLVMRLKSGLNGTPMPSYPYPDEDLWAMVHYIVSLQDEATRVSPHPTSCAAHAAGD